MPTEVVDAEIITDSTGETLPVPEPSESFLPLVDGPDGLDRKRETEPIERVEREKKEFIDWLLLPPAVNADMLVKLEAALVSGMGLFLFFSSDSGKWVKGLGYTSYVLGLLVLAS